MLEEQQHFKCLHQILVFNVCFKAIFTLLIVILRTCSQSNTKNKRVFLITKLTVTILLEQCGHCLSLKHDCQAWRGRVIPPNSVLALHTLLLCSIHRE